MPQPQAHLIQVVVTIEPHGSLPYEINSYYDNKTADPLGVNVGDQVGWLVQVSVDGNLQLMPYSLDFSQNTSFFGMPSLGAPAGGASSFLTVLTQRGHLKYSINIPGLRTIDPDMQSGGDNTVPFALGVRGVANTVFWDTTNPANPMTYSANGAPQQQLPIQNVNIGDSVIFNAIVPPGAVVTDFLVQFVRNRWASPFDPLIGKFSAANGTTIGPESVCDTADSGGTFQFTASITVNGATITTGNVPQNAIDLA
ncbi:MAG: hypothetical protein ABSB35_10260 [Bryobacteraceae bacterium]|jgi:hypothetical protein